MVTVQPLTKKHKISWQLLKIKKSIFVPYPLPLPPRSAGREIFLWGFAGGRSPPAKPLIFSPPSQRRIRRWEGGRGRGKSYKSQRFIHRRLAAWRQSESYLTFSFLHDVRQHMAPPSRIESSESAVSESQNHSRGTGCAVLSHQPAHALPHSGATPTAEPASNAQRTPARPTLPTGPGCHNERRAGSNRAPYFPHQR